MGLSTSKQKTVSNSTQTGNATTNPVAPDWLTGALQNYTNQVGAYGASDPGQYAAPASPLQSQAFAAAANLGGWQAGAGQAAQVAQGVSGQGPNSASLGGYAAPTLGAAATYAPGQIGPMQTAGTATAAQDMAAYQNPYDSQVIATTLAGIYQNADRTRAAQAAQAAKAGAFGGSRYGIAQAQTEGTLAAQRANAEAQLRQQGFNSAAQLGAGDAAARNAASQFNAGQANQATLSQAQLADAASRYGADQTNQFALQQAQLAQAASQFGASAANQAAMFNAGQADNSAARQLQAAGLIGDIANNSANNARSDLGLTADLGGQQRDIDAAQRASPLAQLQALAQLYGAIPTNALVGQSSSNSETSNGTSTQTSTPSGFSQILAALQTAAAFIPIPK